MDLPLVSILINNYNYARFLPCAIDSALGQTYANIEVIVVDDGSTDNSREVITSYGAKIIPVLKANGGQASAFNAGFRHSTGEIICFLDADDFYPPAKVERLVNLFQLNPRAGWIFHGLSYVNAQGEPFSPAELSKFPHFETCDACQNYYQEATRVDYRTGFSQGKRFIYWAPGPTGQCFTRQVLEKILPMPEGESVTLGDRYVEYAAFYLSPGLQTPEKLGCQRFHDANFFTFQANAATLSAIIGIKTAFHLRERFPLFKRHTDQMFAASLGQLLGHAGIRRTMSLPECRQYCSRHFSWWQYYVQSPRLVINLLRSVRYRE